MLATNTQKIKYACTKLINKHGKSTRFLRESQFQAGSDKPRGLHLAGKGVGNGKAAEFIDAPIAIFPATWAWKAWFILQLSVSYDGI